MDEDERFEDFDWPLGDYCEACGRVLADRDCCPACGDEEREEAA